MASKPPPSTDRWSAPLSRPIKLKSGEELLTLRDAAELIGDDFHGVMKDAVMEDAVEMLLKATESGEAADRRAATGKVIRLLRMRSRLP